MADSTLEAIRTKVRRLTRSPSTSQITDNEIDEYVNTFVLYDFPEYIKSSSLRENFIFYTRSNTGEYSTNTTNPDDPLYNFKNIYQTFSSPTYCDGHRMMFSQSQEEFRSLYSNSLELTQVGTGDGVTVTFSGTLSGFPVVPGNVVVSSIAADGSPLSLYDKQVLNIASGIPSIYGDLIETNSTLTAGTMNYTNGVYIFVFSVAPGAGEKVNFHTSTYKPARPNTIFYFNDTFHVRPIPDQVYKISVEASKRPSELLAGKSPELEQYWEYISYGASKKLLEDRMDLESVALLMPEFKQQELLVNRRSIDQKARGKIKTFFNSGSIFNRGPFGRW